MKKVLLAAAVALSALTAGAALAEGSLSYNISATNNYVWRGVSQSEKEPAVQGGIDYANGNFYVGAWGSNVSFEGDEETSLEVDVYAGIKPVVGNFTFDFGAVYYAYPDNDGLNFGELKGGFSHPMGAGSIGAVMYVNWETLENPYYELNASQPIGEKFSVSGAIAKQEFDGGDYSTWNIGLGYALNETLSLDVRYWDTGDHGLGDSLQRNPFKEQVAVSIKAAF